MDQVNHPAHYNAGKIEVIEALEDWKLNFHCANAVKYIARAGKKDPMKEIEDLEKAVWYLNRKIENLKAAKENRAPIRPNDMNPRTKADTSATPASGGRPPALPVSGTALSAKKKTIEGCEDCGDRLSSAEVVVGRGKCALCMTHPERRS